jgi:transcriptional regulator with XRE-family HTH domain
MMPNKKKKTPAGQRLGRLVAEARTALGWSQTELAERLSAQLDRTVSRTYVGGLEAGFTARPGVDVMEAIEQTLGIARESLLRASGWLGESGIPSDLLTQLRQIRALPTLEARIVAARRLPPEAQATIEALAVDLLRHQANQQ